MKVTLYSKYNSVSPVKILDIYKAIEGIKNGTYKEQVLKARSYISSKEKYDIEKKKLPLIGWNGTFSTRANDNLKEHSGFATLDFDKVDDLQGLIELINSDPYTFCSFITPSGRGVKVLVKIPKVATDSDYKSFYHELENNYNQYHKCDPANKDISRASFISYDPNLYINNNSELFTDRFVPKNIVSKPVDVILDNEDEVVKKLLVWFQKKWRSGKDRNNHLFILSSAFNDYGVNKQKALNYCLNYVQSDFKEKEIVSLVNSAYKKTENFNTKHFEDKKKKTRIKNMLFSGVPKENIKSKFNVKDSFIEKIEDETPKEIFWEITEKGSIKISFYRFDLYLKSKGIYKYFQSDESTQFDFIIKDGNFINWIDTKRVKDIVKKDLISNGNIDVWDCMAGNSKYFSSEYLSMLDTLDVDYKRDSKKSSYIYYKNGVIKTTANNIELIDYKDNNSLVWKNQIIDRDIELKDASDGVFKTFIWKVSGENVDRYYTLKSVIGYLLHSYQNEAKAKSIIFNDEMISEDIPNGGSGKGLIHKAIGKLKNVVTEDGKKFDPKGQFAYQKVKKDTQVFLIDDVPKHFNFENLFSVVTEGMTVEEKNMKPYNIPFNESPKISITTNYTVNGSGPSFLRRVFEVELANYFNDKHTPEDEFEHTFFTDWDKNEWHKFDNFMIRCLQYYLKNGLVESKKVNLAYRKLVNNLGAEFIEFMEGKDLSGLKVDRKELRDEFNSLYKNIARYNTAQKFNRKVAEYCNYYNIELDPKHKYNGIIYFMFGDVNNKEQEDEIEF